MQLQKVMATGFLFALVGCGGDNPPGDLPPGGEVPLDAPEFAIAAGAGFATTPGQVNYVVTANVGGVYRLVWTGDDAPKSFSGSVWTEGSFLEIVPGCDQGVCPLSGDDFLSEEPVSVTDGQRIDFEATTAAELKGFDFFVDTEPVFFELFVDGVADETIVIFPDANTGGQPATPSVIPFALIVQ